MRSGGARRGCEGRGAHPVFMAPATFIVIAVIGRADCRTDPEVVFYPFFFLPVAPAVISIRSPLRTTVRVARLGGDGREEAATIPRRTVETFRSFGERCPGAGPGASAGVCDPVPPAGIAEVLHSADAAMLRTKSEADGR